MDLSGHISSWATYPLGGSPWGSICNERAGPTGIPQFDLSRISPSEKPSSTLQYYPQSENQPTSQALNHERAEPDGGADILWVRQSPKPIWGPVEAQHVYVPPWTDELCGDAHGSLRSQGCGSATAQSTA